MNNILCDISHNLKDSNVIPNKKREKILKELDSLKLEFNEIEIHTEIKPVYISLMKKGVQLSRELKINKNHNDIYSKIKSYIRYVKAAKADFKGESGYIHKYISIYILTSILFLALSPQYFGFILPAIFIAPIFLGLKGIKKRSIHGFILSLSVIPVAIMTSCIWIRYGFYVICNYQSAISETIKLSGQSEIVSKILTIFPPIFAVLLLFLALIMIKRAYKSRELFI